MDSVTRLVVKLGTAVCIRPDGRFNGGVLMSLARQVDRVRRQGRQVVLVSSGAVGMGAESLRELKRDDLPHQQALATVGQVELMSRYRQLFSFLHVPVAQVLLSRDDLDARERYLNARNTLMTLLSAGVLPVVNENDSVATEELRFGDHDILASLVGAQVDAQLVVNLTQAAGVLDATGSVIPVVEEIDDSLFRLDRGTRAAGGTGGLRTKLEAARAAGRYGAIMVVARAEEEDVLGRILRGEPLGTRFLPRRDPLAGRKRWLAMGGRVRGSLAVDAGAARALCEEGGSLLPVGITGVEGDFRVGDLVAVCDPGGAEIARGLTNYSSEDLRRLLGETSARIPEILGYRGFDEAIHRDNMIILEKRR